ncbi:hypothetical protein POSPLADRAFT_1185086 [Postia placenta MAD-698-R-SB12]|uniref:BPL/LPL catalytic domain-containing protein n=1 Tax=Postia placenta MAD-698-R-SB12 TaxID=670580 RepID=A0A1X6MPC9_9APHY|nr:hypothetical protein POSPLADRAFT_1185086 [Postia placenta MAD-698-R-SB12]OSX58235.1 hypothetical protein POSPLADRAFT_1185086 [Postia placenta MAD-698-R-SB12]
MNVLVFSGPEVLPLSLTQSITSLRSLLVPNYAVQSITSQSLLSHPWSDNCALLVFPSCRNALSNPNISDRVESYITNGGAILSIGARVRCRTPHANSSRTLEGAMSNINLTGERPIRLSSKSSDCTVDVFLGNADAPSRLAAVRTNDGEPATPIVRLGSSNLISVKGDEGLEVVARYADVEDAGIAAAGCRIGKGRAVFWDSLIDYTLTAEPATSLLSNSSPPISPDEIAAAEEQRKAFLRLTLKRLGLVPPEQKSAAASPLPQILTSVPSKAWIVERILHALEIVSLEQSYTSQDSNDTFEFHAASEEWKVLQDARESATEQIHPTSWQPKIVVVCKDGVIPPSARTPLFDIRKFYDELDAARRSSKSSAPADGWGIGEALLYGEVVTSTQTLLDKNTRLLSTVPAPLLSLASHQLAGRGRGGNIWLSPAGCLQFSLLLRVSLAQLPAPRLVFVQYLFGLAVVQACRQDGVLGSEGHQIRLKWPNDIYAVRADGEKRKVGGILVNTSFSSGQVEIVIGCGLNVYNPPPIQSLLQLVPANSDLQLSMERTAAIIMSTFETMWETFLVHKGSFAPFMDLYYDRWLHSDQLVELTTTTPHQKVRIIGITGDHGLLRTMPESDGWSNAGSYIDLQPDGNSFDLMAGLIKTKT